MIEPRNRCMNPDNPDGRTTGSTVLTSVHLLERLNELSLIEIRVTRTEFALKFREIL